MTTHPCSLNSNNSGASRIHSDPAHDNDEIDIARKCDTVPAYILSICSFRAPSFIERMTLRYQLNESPNPAHTGPGIYVFLFVYP